LRGNRLSLGRQRSDRIDEVRSNRRVFSRLPGVPSVDDSPRDGLVDFNAGLGGVDEQLFGVI
jgi:hypothetical protein